MNEHRIVIVIDAVYRTDNPEQTALALQSQHYAITARRAQAVPARQAWAHWDESADHLIEILENNDAQ